MKNVPLLVGTVLATLALIVGISVAFSQDGGQSVAERVEPARLLTSAPHVISETGVESTTQSETDSTSTSTDSAAVESTPAITIVEFSDFQCPACRATQPALKAALRQYPGDVQVVYRHFPLVSIHQYATLAARASEVAAEEGVFWEYHDKLFETQPTWSVLTSEAEVREQFAEYAVELGIDKTIFLERIESDHIKQAVAEDVALANELKLNSTPTIFVNGLRTTAPELDQTIQSELSPAQN